MTYKLPDLPYAHDALEPYIDEETMKLHHGKHHNTYVNTANEALEEYPELKEYSVEELLQKLDEVPEAVRTKLRNNAGGHANHSLFWEVLSPNGGGEPVGALADAINDTFGSLDNLKDEILAAGTGQFGSGWAWLVVDNGDLKVTSTPNQDSPLSNGQTPIFGVDVWEHAYYLNYQNVRPDYIKAIWNIVNWEEVNRRYEEAK